MDDQIPSHDEGRILQLLKKQMKTWVWWKVALFVLLLFPVILLIGIFEVAGSFLVVVSVFVFSITIYKIFAGDGTPLIVLLCIGSTSVLAAYFIVFPLVAQSKRFKQFKSRWI